MRASVSVCVAVLMLRAPGAAALDLIAESPFLRSGPHSGVAVEVPAAGQDVYFHLALRVDASGGVIGVPFEATIDGQAFCAGVADLGPGAATVWCADAWTAEAGQHTLRWRLDRGGLIAEDDEANNAAVLVWSSSGGATPTRTAAATRTRTAAATPTDASGTTINRPRWLPPTTAPTVA